MLLDRAGGGVCVEGTPAVIKRSCFLSFFSRVLETCATSRQPASVCVASEQVCSENNDKNGCIKPAGCFEDRLLQCGRSVDGKRARSCKPSWHVKVVWWRGHLIINLKEERSSRGSAEDGMVFILSARETIKACWRWVIYSLCWQRKQRFKSGRRGRSGAEAPGPQGCTEYMRNWNFPFITATFLFNVSRLCANARLRELLLICSQLQANFGAGGWTTALRHCLGIINRAAFLWNPCWGQQHYWYLQTHLLIPHV